MPVGPTGAGEAEARWGHQVPSRPCFHHPLCSSAGTIPHSSSVVPAATTAPRGGQGAPGQKPAVLQLPQPTQQTEDEAPAGKRLLGGRAREARIGALGLAILRARVPVVINPTGQPRKKHSLDWTPRPPSPGSEPLGP